VGPPPMIVMSRISCVMRCVRGKTERPHRGGER
jgi:hypothetical protein